MTGNHASRTLVEVLDAKGNLLGSLPFTVELPPAPVLDPETCGGLGCPGVCREGMFRGQTVQMTCSSDVPAPGALCACTVDCPVPPIPCKCVIDGVITVRVKAASGSLAEFFTADDAMTCSRASARCGDPPAPRSHKPPAQVRELVPRLRWTSSVHVPGACRHVGSRQLSVGPRYHPPRRRSGGTNHQ